MEKYKNRYGDIFTFTELENGNILWEGDFEHCRFGWPNDYSEAYDEYLRDNLLEQNDDLSLEDFKEEVHHFIYDEYDNYVGPSEIAEDYGSLVKSNTDVINMVDPSGGPYLTAGMDMERFGFSGKVVKEFKNRLDGWEIIVAKTDNEVKSDI